MRRDSKPEIDVPRKASFVLSSNGDSMRGWIVRLSIVGVEIESLQSPSIGSDVIIRAELLEGEGEVTLRGRVQWATPTRFAVQFGPLGARDTNMIVRATRSAA